MAEIIDPEGFTSLRDEEINSERSAITSALAGVASGVIKVPEGVISLGAELIDLGFDTDRKSRLRFKGVDTWEKRTRNKEEKVKGLAAKAYVQDLLENSDEGKFSIISHGRGKYGRVLGEIFVKGHEKSVNELLKENGHAYEYHGEKKKVFGS